MQTFSGKYQPGSAHRHYSYLGATEHAQLLVQSLQLTTDEFDAAVDDNEFDEEEEDDIGTMDIGDTYAKAAEGGDVELTVRGEAEGEDD